MYTNNFDERVNFVLSLVKEKMMNEDFKTQRLEYFYLNISKNEWISLFNYLQSEGLIESKYSYDDFNNKKEFLSNLSITIKGANYLQRNEIIAYPSAKSLLAVAKAEYERETQRTNTIDLKISTLIALLAFMFPVYIGLLDVKFYKEEIYHWAYIIFVFFVILLNVISLLFLLKAITTRAYRGISLEDIINDSNIYEEENIIDTSLLVPYTNAVNQNRKQNDDRAITYNWATLFIKISMCLGFVLIIANKMFF